MNSPTTSHNSNAACASDTDTHTVTYAVSPPDGLQPPQAGAGVEGSMLAAALHINNPFPGQVITAVGDLPPEDSLAWCADPRAIVTAIKQGTVDPGQMIVRLYQPTNSPLGATQVNISKFLAGAYSSDGLLIASAVNALERPTTESAITQRSNVSVTMTLPYAIETLALGG